MFPSCSNIHVFMYQSNIFNYKKHLRIQKLNNSAFMYRESQKWVMSVYMLHNINVMLYIIHMFGCLSRNKAEKYHIFGIMFLFTNHICQMHFIKFVIRYLSSVLYTVISDWTNHTSPVEPHCNYYVYINRLEIVFYNL